MITTAFLTFTLVVITVLIIGVQRAKKKRNGASPEEYNVDWNDIVGESE